MKNLLAFGLALAFAGAAVAGVLPSSNSGTISVYVPGAVGTAAAQPAFQSSVAFRTTGTGKLKNPRIWLACYQNGALVYGDHRLQARRRHVNVGSERWRWATCTADLYYILNANGTGEWNGKGAQGKRKPRAHRFRRDRLDRSSKARGPDSDGRALAVASSDRLAPDCYGHVLTERSLL
jgi:hypothetical protein